MLTYQCIEERARMLISHRLELGLSTERARQSQTEACGATTSAGKGLCTL